MGFKGVSLTKGLRELKTIQGVTIITKHKMSAGVRRGGGHHGDEDQ